MTETRDARIELRVEPSLKAAAHEQARKTGVPVSTVLRDALIADTGWKDDQ